MTLAVSDFQSEKHLSKLIRRTTETTVLGELSEEILIFKIRKDFSISAFGYFEVGFGTMSRVSVNLYYRSKSVRLINNF